VSAVRTTRSFRATVGVCLIVAAASVAVPARAWVTTECNGSVRGIRSNVTYKLNRCSIDFGSAREGLILYAMNEWNRVIGVHDRFSTTSGSSSCDIDTDDGVFDVAFVDPGQIDDNAGLTALSWEACVWPFPGFADGEVTDADVFIANNMPLNSLDELDGTLGGRETAIHEFGHVLGMDHVNDRMTIMCEFAGTCGKFGARDALSGTLFGNTESLLPDDVHFAARWHSSSGGAIEVGASAWTIVGLTYQRTHPTLQTFVACPGQAVSVSFSHGIKGKNHVPSTAAMPARIVLSGNAIISAADTTALSFSVFGNRGQFFTNTFPVTIPTLPAGTYELGLVLDATNTVAETDEGNNTTRLNRRVTIPAVCP
jgi:hypothetical protein